MSSLRIGIDIGGTFTDFVIYNLTTQHIRTFKLLSTPLDPADAVLTGLAAIFEQTSESLKTRDSQPATIIHGSTVATNALLERKGALTALVTTHGFRDVLQIGRQNRPTLYDLFADTHPALVPSERRFEVNERVDHEGTILKALDPDEVDSLITALRKTEAKTVAVCLLFSFLRAEHERLIGEKLRQAGFMVSLSSDILPEFREYERTSTTTVNAYVSPVLDKYLSTLENNLASFDSKEKPRDAQDMGVRLQVMQSNGGSISPSEARREAVRCILSGPAGGVVGCEYVGRIAFTSGNTGKKGKKSRNTSANSEGSRVKLITFDMGGTSTDVSLIDDKPQITTESVVSSCPIRIPMLDIHSIGAGGGSIAWVDVGGVLRVGPESAGADPGPACYGRGNFPTVTDANVVLGRIPPDFFLGGKMLLDFKLAYSALSRLGKVIMLSAEQTALGVVAVANAHMERALRVISVERGHDPRAFTMLSFGGAGGLHACDLARGLGITRVLIPPLASTLSAFGMLAADVIKDYTRTIMMPGDTPTTDLAALLEPMVQNGCREVLAERVPSERIRVERSLDMRYRGQSYELIVPFNDSITEEFHRLHEMRYGYAKLNAPIEVVNLRVRVIGEVTPPSLLAGKKQGPDPSGAFIERREVFFAPKKYSTPLYRAEALQPGNRVIGPAVVVRADTTILIGPIDQVEVDLFGNFIIEVGA